MLQVANHKTSFAQWITNSHRLDRDYPLQLRCYFQHFRIEGPIVQIGHCALEERRHARITRFDVPVMACIIGEWPCYSNQANEKANRIFSGVLIQQLA
jgi:hypothetical protein